MKNAPFALFLVCALLLGSSAEVAAQTSRPSRNRDRKVSKRELKTEKILGLDWYGSLDAAIAANRAAKKQERPIFYLRLLGDLRGKT